MKNQRLKLFDLESRI